MWEQMSQCMVGGEDLACAVAPVHCGSMVRFPMHVEGGAGMYHSPGALWDAGVLAHCPGALWDTGVMLQGP